ncbi:MAG: TIGR00269 family protein [Candidatus Nanohaloarchaea archaeon]|nr:TIGR00269 family protein [Candidatus Nanohaloarchaea archaeon]
MDCTKCGDPAVITREYEGRSLCRKHFSRSVEEQVKATMREHNLVDDGDTIAVGLSGGKDSGVLLQILADTFGDRPDIGIEAVCVHEGIDPYRGESVEQAEEMCDRLDVPIHVVSYEDEYDVTMDEVMVKQPEMHSCSYCGVLRRDAINRKAREIGADKLAVGHNLDDEVQSAVMNLLRGDVSRLARMGAKTHRVPSDRFTRRIKPLRDVREREIALYAEVNDLEVHIETCPHAEGALRADIRNFLNDLEQERPGIKNTALSSIDELLPVLRENFYGDAADVTPCEECGEPSSRDVCRKCELLAAVNDS